VDTSVVKNVVLWGVVPLAIAGVAFGLLPFLFGFAGDPGESLDGVDPNSTEADQQANEEAVANEIIMDELSDENASAVNSYDQMNAQNDVAGDVIGSTFLGLIFAFIAALLIGFRSSTDDVSLAAGVAVATVVGLLLFVLLSSAIAGFQYNSMSNDDWKNEHNTNPSDWSASGYPASDVGQGDELSDAEREALSNDGRLNQQREISVAIQQRYLNEYEDQYGEEPETEYIGDAATVSQVNEIRGFQINYISLLINTLLYGIAGAVGAAGIAVASKRLSADVA
jgi:hypothetical protein